MGKDGNKDDQDPLDGLLIEDEEGPTRTLSTVGDALRRTPGPASPSIGSFVASEEALRVFDEMSNPGEYSIPGGASVTFRGRVEEESRLETLAPVFPEGDKPAPVPSVDGLDPDLGDVPALPTAPKLPHGLATSQVAAYREGWMAFEFCPCPLFRLDGLGRIQSANKALCEFLGSSADSLHGNELHNTRLGRLYASLENDVQECLSTREGLQRFLSFQDAEGRVVRFLLWLVPIPPASGHPKDFAGIILPFPGE